MLYINYHENMQRGTADFPIEFYHVTSEHPRYYMPIHWHMEFEFIRVLQGNLLLTLNETTMNVSENDVVFIPSGFLHSAIPENDCIYDCIVLDPDMLICPSEYCRKAIRKIVKHQTTIRSLYSHDHSDICKIIWSMFDALATKPKAYELIIYGTLFHFLGIALSQNLGSELPSYTQRNLNRITQIKQALEYIESHYTMPFTLQELSASVGMSPKYFCKFFKEMTHRTPFDYINYYRIERACDLLQTTNLSIADICQQCGYNDLSYFIKIFKKYKGTTPKQYQK